jgi:hypothetical protein
MNSMIGRIIQKRNEEGDYREMSYSLLPEEVMMEGRMSIMNGK